MKFKKILSVALLMCTTMVSTIPAYANNSSDTTLPTEYISSTTYVSTEYRAKTDDSYHYIFNQTSIEVRAISYSQNGTNCTKGSYAAIPSNSKRFITNYVYENGYSNCRLSIRSNISGASAILSGKWSPDSVGSYTVANP
jgi:hypothetical protein